MPAAIATKITIDRIVPPLAPRASPSRTMSAGPGCTLKEPGKNPAPWIKVAFAPTQVIATRNQTSREGLKWQVLIYD